MLFDSIFAIVISVTVLSEVECRKYDLELEAKKLYGESLYEVLRRFRRTPEYEMILNDRMKEFQELLAETLKNNMIFYREKVKEKARELYKEDAIDLTSRARKLFHSGRRLFPYNQRTQGKRMRTEYDIDNKTSVEHMEEYYKNAKLLLTTNERNAMKEYAFGFVGEMIDSIIKAVNLEDENQKSTKLPEDIPATQNHNHVPPSKASTKAPENDHHDATLRLKQKG